VDFCAHVEDTTLLLFKVYCNCIVNKIVDAQEIIQLYEETKVYLLISDILWVLMLHSC